MRSSSTTDPAGGSVDTTTDRLPCDTAQTSTVTDWFITMDPVRAHLAKVAPGVELLENLRYDAGEEGDYCYIVTEHVHGARTLAAYCKPDNLLRIDDVVEIVYKCARALHYAH